MYASKIKQGYELLERSEGLPGVVKLHDEESPSEQSPFVELNILITCGHYKVTESRPVSEEEYFQRDKKENTLVDAPVVLSRKEQRKQRKAQKKKQVVPAVVD